MKARLVYLNAKKQDHQLGWKSLMEALKEDSPTVYDEIRGKLAARDGDTVSDEQRQVIAKFVHKKFACRPSHINSIFVKNYDNGKYIIVETDETFCSIVDEEHSQGNSPRGIYFVIGLASAKEKCRHPDCSGKYGTVIKSSSYDATFKEVVEAVCMATMPDPVGLDAETLETPRGSDTSDELDYQSVKRIFEKDWFRLFSPPVFIQIDGDEIEFRKKSELRHIAGLLTFEEVSQTKAGNKRVDDVNFLNKWLKDPFQRTFRRIDFLPPPLRCDKETFNTFPRFAGECLQPNAVDVQVDLGPILTLLYDLCDREEQSAEYILSWMADIVQRPGQLSRVGIVMQSKQGRGKNLLFGSLFGNQILGQSLYFSSANPEDFFGRFATGRFKRLLSNFNEIECSHTSKIMGKVKEAITEPTVSFEAKGIMTVRVRNCARQLWFSNEIMPIRIPHDDRRWLAVRASAEMPEVGTQEHKEYFSQIAAWIEDSKNVRAFFDFLKDRDISKWHPEYDRPTTSFYTGLQRLSLNRVEQWLIAQLEDQRLPGKMLSDVVLVGVEKMFPNCGLQVGFIKEILESIPGIKYGTPTVDRVKARGFYFKHPMIISHYVGKGFMTDPALFVDDSDSY